MTLQREDARVLNGGLVTGFPPHAIGLLESPDCSDIDPADPLGATTRPGSSQYGVDFAAGSGFRGVGLFPWTRNNGTTYVFAALGTTIYSVDAGSWFSIKTGMATDSIMQGAGLNNVAILVGSGLFPQVSSAGSTLASVTAGTYLPSTAKFATIYMAKCFLAGDPNNPSRVSFSASGDPQDWATTNNSGNIDVQKDDGDVIRGIIGTRGACYVFKRKSTYAITGDSPFNFNTRLLCSWGIPSPYAYDTDGNGCFFASDDGIYYANGLSVARISDPIRANYSALSDLSTLALAVKGEKLFVFHKASGATENNRAYVLAFKRKMEDGGVRGVWCPYLAQPYQVAKTGRDQTLYALTNASTAQLWKLDVGSSGNVTAYWTTPDMDFGDLTNFKRMTRYFVHMKPDTATTTLTVQHYIDGATSGSDTTLTFGTSGSHSIQTQAGQSTTSQKGKFFRLRLQWSGQKTIYGFSVFADVLADEMARR